MTEKEEMIKLERRLNEIEDEIIEHLMGNINIIALARKYLNEETFSEYLLIRNILFPKDHKIIIQVQNWKPEKVELIRNVQFYRSNHDGFLEISEVAEDSPAGKTKRGKFQIALNTPRTLESKYANTFQHSLVIAKELMEKDNKRYEK